MLLMMARRAEVNLTYKKVHFSGIFSVSGRKCLGGRVMDPSARYWYCRTDSNDWDYSCRPGSTCGYTDGYSFSW